MKTIRIDLDIKNRLVEFGDGTSSNKALRLLLDQVEEPSEVIECAKPQYYNIKIDDDLLDKLNRCKKYSKESHSQVISRLLDEKMG